jgi:hypothetical protein
MKREPAGFSFRWVLPLAQLLVCLVALWPVRWFLFFEVSHATKSLPSQGGSIQLTQADMDAIERAAAIRDRLMKVPVLLDFPVLLVEAGYTLAKPANRGWAPGGMEPDTWRALTWPFAGVLFWWSAGRGIEAFRAARRSVVFPRITLVETVFATVLVCVGVVTFVGIFTSTPADRHDFDFMMLLGGGLLWGILAATAVTARVLQWKILKRAAVLA